MDRENIIESEPLNGKQDPNHGEKFIVKLLHKKGSVVQLVRTQMNNLEQKYTRKTNRRSNTFWKRLWSPGCFLVFLIALLAWLSIIYGILLGTTLCTDFSIPRIPIPGLRFT